MATVHEFRSKHSVGATDVAAYEGDVEDVSRIHVAGVWRQQIVDHFANPGELVGDRLPWSKSHGNVRLREGELSIWAGPNGCGKSMMLSQLALDLAIKQNRTTLIASMEMAPLATLARMAHQATEKIAPSPDDVDLFLKRLRSNIWLYDQVGTVTPQRIRSVIRYAREHVGADHVIVDSLMKCGISTEDLDAQKRFVDWLSTYAKDTGVHIHLVAHNRKSSGEDSIDGKYSIKGASEISDMADNVLLCWRNKRKEQAMQAGEADDETLEAPDACINVDKQRHGSWEGKILLWFNQPTCQYVGRNTRETIGYLRRNWEQTDDHA
jgi:twinkle protein